ncbi:MAG: hypothetical protein WBA76_13055 [Phormidesmis sp.]
MFIQPFVFAATLAINIFPPFYQDCTICRPETIYMPKVPTPEITLLPKPVSAHSLTLHQNLAKAAQTQKSSVFRDLTPTKPVNLPKGQKPRITAYHRV